MVKGWERRSCGDRGTIDRQDADSDRLYSYVANQFGLAAVTGRQASGSEQLARQACLTPRTSHSVVLPRTGPNERLLLWIQATELCCMFQLSHVSTPDITVAVFWERLRRIFSLTLVVVREHYFAVSWMAFFFSTWHFNLIYRI